MLGPAGAVAGSSLGDWGSNILGLGDYEVKANSLLEGNGVPTMQATKRGFIVQHKEFLGDVTGSTAFTNRVYPIQPGSSRTFPWLCNIAAMYQSYKILGLSFTFNSMSADALNSVNTALGTVIMATQYNVAQPDFLNKAEMEQYEYTCTTRPSASLVHLVECDPNLQVMEHLYTRTGNLPVGVDKAFYDWGTFQLATVGMQAAATIGELWVSYEVEFLKPRIPSGGAWPGDFTKIQNGAYTAGADVLGSVQTDPTGTLGVTITNSGAGWDTVTLPSNITAGRFMVVLRWRGGVAAAIAKPALTFTNLTVQGNFDLSTTSQAWAPVDGAVSTFAEVAMTFVVNGYSATGSSIQVGVAGTLPATPSHVSIWVVALPLTDSGF